MGNEGSTTVPPSPELEVGKQRGKPAEYQSQQQLKQSNRQHDRQNRQHSQQDDMEVELLELKSSSAGPSDSTLVIQPALSLDEEKNLLGSAVYTAEESIIQQVMQGMRSKGFSEALRADFEVFAAEEGGENLTSGEMLERSKREGRLPVVHGVRLSALEQVQQMSHPLALSSQ
jgi:hypothetical protein